MEKCFDEGTIQAFLDGELSHEIVEKFTHHIAICDSCANSVTAAESEIEFTFSSLNFEENNLIPTERLWSKINFSIEAESKNRSIWKNVLAFLSSPSAIGFASLVIVFGLFAGLYSLKNSSEVELVTSVSTKPNSKAETVKSIASTTLLPVEKSPDLVPVEQPRNSDDEAFKPRTAVYVRREQAPQSRSAASASDATLPSTDLLAEESYMKTISTLENTINSRKDEVFQSSSRFAYERDLAVADDTISKMKKEVRNNPNNEAARILLRTSYQNKIDLLNSVAEKSELMASLN